MDATTRQQCKMIELDGWLVVLRIYIALVVFQPYRDLEAGDNQSLKFKWQGGESNPCSASQELILITTWPPRSLK